MTAKTNPTELQPWAPPIYRVLKKWQVGQVGYVPDAGHRVLIDVCLADESLETVVLTTEEEGVAMAAGAWLGGVRSVVLMQSSGIGNCINMFSMIRECGIPLLTVITMRGENSEFNPWQKPMGDNAESHLKLCGFQVSRINQAGEAESMMDQAAGEVFGSCSMGAVLISQQLIGVKSFGNDQ